MKTNGGFDGGAMKDDPKIYAAYALYLSKFVASYRAEGVDVFMVVPQNEPGQLTHYPSCDWTPAQYTRFIGSHLGPLLRGRHPETQIFAGTINRGDWDLLSVLRDPGAGAFISGVALQWGGLDHAARVRQAFPKVEIMQSETECGNEHWQPGFDPQRPPNDFAYAAHTWRKFRDYIGAGSSSYFLWNMVLDERGMNIDRLRPWPQNSAVVVDRKTRKVSYTPMFWATKHFSGLVDPGARLVETSGRYTDRIAFVNPDGSVIVELLNASAEPVQFNIVISEHGLATKLPARSFASVQL
jgi:glucosylceramidase